MNEIENFHMKFSEILGSSRPRGGAAAPQYLLKKGTAASTRKRGAPGPAQAVTMNIVTACAGLGG